MKKILVAFLLTAIALTACTSVASKQQIALSGKQAAEIQAAVRYSMIDPTSSMFRNIRAYDAVLTDGKSYRLVCGEVNSKNRMGGYSGFSAFKGHYEGPKFVLDYVDSYQSSMAAMSCS